MHGQPFNLFAFAYLPLYCMVQTQRVMKAEHLGLPFLSFSPLCNWCLYKLDTKQHSQESNSLFMNLKADCKQNTCFALVLVHSRSWKYLFEGLVLGNYLRVHNFRAYGCQAQIPTSLNQQLEKMSLEHCWFKEAARQQLWLAASSLQVQTSQALSMWITSACLHSGLPPSSPLLTVQG